MSPDLRSSLLRLLPFECFRVAYAKDDTLGLHSYFVSIAISSPQSNCTHSG